MTLPSMLALFMSMIILAAIPGPGIMVVVSRTLSGGFVAGAVVALGIVMGDYIFIALAIGGLSALANTFQEVFQFVKYAGAAYLVFLGVRVLFPSKSPAAEDEIRLSSQSANVLAGLVTTLSNPKAILFYVSFFPAFLKPTTSAIDLLLIYSIASIAIGGVMLLYAFIASTGRKIVNSGVLGEVFKYLSGFTLIGCGAMVATKA